MKKFITILLVLTMILSLCACGGSGEGKKMEGLHAGYSRQSIMPNEPVGLGGYSDADTRKSNGYLDYVYLTCIAFAEGEDTVLMYTADMCGASAKTVAEVRLQVAEATGVPGNRIMFSSTHTHSGPSVGYDDHYGPVFFGAAVTAAKEAIADLAPATLYGANAKAEGLTFTRHYLQEDGTVSSPNLGNLDLDSVVGHARPADDEMVLIKMDREGDKKDIMLMNFQAHPTGNSSGTNYNLLSADYIGAVRDAFEQETGMHFAFFQGAGGDLVTDSRIPSLRHKMETREYGAALAKIAVEAMPTMEQVSGEGIKVEQYTLNYACNHYGEDKLAEARQAMNLYKSNKAGGTQYAKEQGFFSISQCRGIVNASANPESADMELDAVYVGGVGFATAPWEMFAQTGMYIKDNSPFKYTCVFSISNGYRSYVPIKEAYDFPSYEGFVAYFGQGAAEAAADQLVTMLKSLQ